MILAHFDLEEPLELSVDNPTVLVLENPSLCYRLSEQLKSQTSGGEGGFSLFEGDVSLSFAKTTVFFTDLLAVSLGEKKLQNGLSSQLTLLSNNELSQEFADLQAKIFAFFDLLNAEAEHPIAYACDSGIAALAKAYSLSWQDEDQSLLSLLVSSIRLYSHFSKTKLFVFLHLKSFLSDEELLCLYKEGAQSQVYLLLVESVCREKIHGEKVVIVDKDLCQILA